ncbi:hypothetical protein ACRRTK_012471 [Alexandromys fortis]
MTFISILYKEDAYHSITMNEEVRRQLAGFSSLSITWVLRSNSSCQSWQQAPSPAGPSHQP